MKATGKIVIELIGDRHKVAAYLAWWRENYVYPKLPLESLPEEFWPDKIKTRYIIDGVEEE